MLQKLKILMLLATIVPESLSAPTKNISLPENPTRLKALEGALAKLGFTPEEFLQVVRTTNFILDFPISEFSSTVMKALREQEGVPKNVVFSPFSIHTTLTAFYLASGKDTVTRTQLSKVLGLKDQYNRKYLANYYRLMDFYERADNTDLQLANNIFINGEFDINPSYLNLLYGFYGTRPEILAIGSDQAVKQINQFVKEKTKGFIADVMLPGSIPVGTQIVAVNAIHHEGEWKIEFDEAMTAPMDFNLPNGTTIRYPYGMSLRSDKLRYIETRHKIVVELPYKNRDYAMYIIMAQEDTLDALEDQVRFFDLEQVEKELDVNTAGLELLLPRFETTYHTSLVKVLQSLGLTTLFDSTQDLEHLTHQAIRVNEIVHEASVKVDEKGSVASGATAAVACTRCNGPTKIYVDRAFGFHIVDKRHNLDLFAGLIVNPFGEDNPDALPIAYPNKLPIAANKTL